MEDDPGPHRVCTLTAARDSGLAISTAQRIWRAVRLKPHRQRDEVVVTMRTVTGGHWPGTGTTEPVFRTPGLRNCLKAKS
jgi:hypothetical protein